LFAIQAQNIGVTFILQREKRGSLLESFIKAVTFSKNRNPPSHVGGREIFWPLRNVTFSIEQGESFGVIGRNGAGKSTLLRILTGIYRPDEGRLEKTGTAGLLQIGAGFHEDLTGRDNIYLNGAILGLKKKEIGLLFDSIVEFSELERFIDTPIKHLSSGMISRLGFSIAIKVRPDILLIDEIFAVGDEGFKEKCNQEMEKIKEMNNTIVLVSHDMDDITRICDRAICLDQGAVVYEGTSREAADYYLESLRGKDSDSRQSP
jgi:lipopolysaccharide transport system ATP-binding protein